MSNAKEGAVAQKPDRKQLAEVGRQIDSIRTAYQQSYQEAGNDYERAVILACSLIDLKQAVKQYLPVLRQMAGNRLGFKTDKDKDQQGYPDAVVVDCAIEAVMREARWTGNEFNIIAGNCYLTKEYWWRKVTTLEGLTDLDLNGGVPEFANGKCVVPFEASWKLHGQRMSLVRRIPIIVRSGQSDDNTLGKAEGRMLKAIHRRVTGTEITDGSDDEPETPAGPSRTADLKNRLNGTATGAAPAIAAKRDEPEDEPEDGPDDPKSPADWSADDEKAQRDKLNATK